MEFKIIKLFRFWSQKEYIKNNFNCYFLKKEYMGNSLTHCAGF